MVLFNHIISVIFLIGLGFERLQSREEEQRYLLLRLIDIVCDPFAFTEDMLRSFRCSKYASINENSSSTFMICNCLGGTHNLVTAAGFKDLILSIVLWESTIHGYRVGVLHFFELCSGLLSLILLWILDMMFVEAVAQVLLANEMPSLLLMLTHIHQSWASLWNSIYSFSKSIVMEGGRNNTLKIEVLVVASAPLGISQILLYWKRWSKFTSISSRHVLIPNFDSVLAKLQKDQS